MCKFFSTPHAWGEDKGVSRSSPARWLRTGAHVVNDGQHGRGSTDNRSLKTGAPWAAFARLPVVLATPGVLLLHSQDAVESAPARRIPDGNEGLPVRVLGPPVVWPRCNTRTLTLETSL